MLTTKNVITSVNDIPISWIFAYYCKIDIAMFDGNDFKINSIFNESDRTPSMSFYVTNIGYKFNDFSSGKKGSAVDLVMMYKKLSFKEACDDIISNYKEWIKYNNIEFFDKKIQIKPKYKVTDYKIRGWNSSDKNYWLSYNISSKILEYYNVKPLKDYTISNDNNEYNIIDDLLYGYFNKNQELCKIYQPNIRDQKFFKVKSYTQGLDQIKNHPFLIYTSSLKDIMSIYSLNLNIDLKAPDSENTLISKDEIESDLKKYKKTFTLFDVDEAGIKAANLYKELYNIQPMFLAYGEKDPSDHIKKYGVKKIAPLLITLFHKHLNNG